MHKIPPKLKPKVPTTPRAGGSVFLWWLQQSICTGSRIAAEVALLPGLPAWSALAISSQTLDPAVAPCCYLHSQPGCNTIIDSSVTGLSYSRLHGGLSLFPSLTPSCPSADFHPERGTTPCLAFNLSLSLCSIHPTAPSHHPAQL